MERIVIKIKRLKSGIGLPLPDYETEGASGMDLRASVTEPVLMEPGEIKLIPTGMAISIPPGYEGQIRPRSGLALKHGVGLINSPGTIDSDYRGEIAVIMINWGDKTFTIRHGDRIAQMIIGKIHRADLMEVDNLDSTKRGDGGFGHSGTN